MKIEDILNSLSAQHRKDIAAHWGVKVKSTNNPSQTVQLIAKAYRDSSNMKKTIKLLNPDNLKALQMLISLSTTYNSGMNPRQAINRVNDLPNMIGRGDATLKSLINKGYLFKVKLQWQDTIVVADEIFFA